MLREYDGAKEGWGSRRRTYCSSSPVLYTIEPPSCVCCVLCVRCEWSVIMSGRQRVVVESERAILYPREICSCILDCSSLSSYYLPSFLIAIFISGLFFFFLHLDAHIFPPSTCQLINRPCFYQSCVRQRLDRLATWTRRCHISRKLVRIYIYCLSNIILT